MTLSTSTSNSHFYVIAYLHKRSVYILKRNWFRTFKFPALGETSNSLRDEWLVIWETNKGFRYKSWIGIERVWIMLSSSYQTSGTCNQLNHNLWQFRSLISKYISSRKYICNPKEWFITFIWILKKMMINFTCQIEKKIYKNRSLLSPIDIVIMYKWNSKLTRGQI